jgi:hypothetical protein
MKRSTTDRPLMPDNVKSKKVTFTNHLPMGQMGSFTHDDELWIAYPRSKNQAIFGLVDKLIGLHAGVQREMIRWLNTRPQDAELVAQVLKWTRQAQTIHRELIVEKGKVFTA